MLYKFVEPDTNVVALKVVKLEPPDAVTELNEGDETTFIIGSFAVPPVIMFEPGCTRVISFVSVVENILYKLVEPDTNVVALKVVKLEPPDAVTELNEGDETIFTVGLFAVPPVVMFEPG
jgi:Trk K+ transport system NAD-binding subunit